MAREEHDREDLLREATALVERIELQLPAATEPLVAGFRRDGAASWYFGADCVYQFNAHGQVRRSFQAGQLIAAERGELYGLTRERTPTATELIRRPFTPEETHEFLSRAHALFADCAAALAAGEFTIVGQHPADVDLVARLRSWLSALPAEIPVASSPGLGRSAKPREGE